MVSHTYHIHLESATIRLPDIDDLLGKDVEVIIRELAPGNPSSNFDAVNQLLTDQHLLIFSNRSKIQLIGKNRFVMSGSKHNCQLITRQHVDDFIGLDDEVVITNPFDK